jgi:histone H3/H4
MDSSDSDEAARANEVAVQLQTSLQHFIERIVRAAADDKAVASGYFPAMATFIYQFTTKCVARDLIAFRNHAGRKTISEDDVILIARKTPFQEHLKSYLADELGAAAKDMTAKKPRSAAGRLDQFKVPRPPRRK